MSGWTNRAKKNIMAAIFQGVALPASFKIALATAAAAPGPDTNLFSELTQIAAGNGYTAGGITLSRNATDFDALTEDDANDLGSVDIKDVIWTGTGGAIPATGAGARYAALYDPVSGELWCYFDLGADRTVSDGQSLTLQDAKMRGKEI